MYDEIATPSTARAEYALNAGAMQPDVAWISTPWDTWERNPHYTGPEVRHPEADDDEPVRSRAELSEIADVSRFLGGARALFTLESEATGAHYTYRLRRPEGKDVTFVSLLTGPQNTSDYTYLGLLADGDLRLTRKSRMTDDSLPVRAVRYLLRGVREGRLPAKLHMYHEGRCACCGRTLTVPESVRTGIGPECAKRYGRGA